VELDGLSCLPGLFIVQNPHHLEKLHSLRSRFNADYLFGKGREFRNRVHSANRGAASLWDYGTIENLHLIKLVDASYELLLITLFSLFSLMLTPSWSSKLETVLSFGVANGQYLDRRISFLGFGIPKSCKEAQMPQTMRALLQSLHALHEAGYNHGYARLANARRYEHIIV
jgi:hypothetical protein